MILSPRRMDRHLKTIVEKKLSVFLLISTTLLIVLSAVLLLKTQMIREQMKILSDALWIRNDYLGTFGFKSLGYGELAVASSIENMNFPDSTIAAYLPANACGACVLSLFSSFQESGIDPNRFIICSELDDRSVQRKAEALGFRYYFLPLQEELTQIVLFCIKDASVSRMMTYDERYDDILSLFLFNLK